MIDSRTLECAINISEGSRDDVLRDLIAAAGRSLLDVHSDGVHNRSVFTLAGPQFIDDAMRLVDLAIDRIDLRQHSGIHPRLGVVDVVPFVPVHEDHWGDDANLGAAIATRQNFGRYLAEVRNVPCFFYGPERSLPEIRRGAFAQLAPDLGPPIADPRTGACCIGARHVLVAYNLWLVERDLEEARSIVRSIRTPDLRCLAFMTGDRVQISCNLVAPWRVGPAEAFDAIAQYATVEHAELVGLISRSVLHRIAPSRWEELDLGEQRTIETRIEQASALKD